MVKNSIKKINSSNKTKLIRVKSKVSSDIHSVAVAPKMSTKENFKNYKEELLKIDDEEEKYDKLFEQKLSKQYKEFRNVKERKTQIKKFNVILTIILIIILSALLLMSF